MECIICQDSGVEPLHDNTSCKCKYKRHVSCWIDYVHSNTILKCPLCRKEIASSKKNNQQYSTPYTPRLYPIQEEPYYQNSYQYQREEDLIQPRQQEQRNSSNLYSHTQAQPNTLQNMTCKEKIVKIVILFGVITVIIILLTVFFV